MRIQSLTLLKIFFLVCLSSISRELYSQHVIISDNSLASAFLDEVEDEINLAGGSAQIASLSPTNISAADQIWILIPSSNFAVEVQNALAVALAEGKRIVFFGDGDGFAMASNARINLLLSSLGAESQLMSADLHFPGCRDVDVTFSTHPLTENLLSPIALAFSSLVIDMGTNASPLIDFVLPAEHFAVAEQVTQGEIVLFGDSNVFISCTTDNNRLLMNNLLNVSVNGVIPTMGQWSLFILSLLLSTIGLTFLHNDRLAIN